MRDILGFFSLLLFLLAVVLFFVGANRDTGLFFLGTALLFAQWSGNSGPELPDEAFSPIPGTRRDFDVSRN